MKTTSNISRRLFSRSGHVDNRSSILSSKSLERLESRHLMTGDMAFEARVDYPTDGAFSNAIEAGDLDGDGDQDLAIGNCSCGGGGLGDVSVLINRGDGTFEAPVRYEAGRHPGTIAIDDIDGDGDNDMAVTGYDASVVWILLNQGDGTFSDSMQVRSPSPDQLDLADINQDGNLDLVVSVRRQTSASVFLGAGTNDDGWAGFEDRRTFRVRNGIRFLSVADFNSDGLLDIGTITRNGSNSGLVETLLGDGNGSFELSSERDSVGPTPTQSHLVEDFNGDGKPDHASIVRDNVSVVLNAGLENGEWDGFQRRKNVSVTQPMGVAAGDLSGDGVPELVVARRSFREVVVTLGAGDGTFEKTDNLQLPGDGRAVEIADFNGDGKQDIVAVSTTATGHVSVFLNATETETAVEPGDSNGDSVFDSSDLIIVFQAGKYEDGISGNATFAEGDWNNDGDFDSGDLIYVFQNGNYILNATRLETSAIEKIFRIDESTRGEDFRQSPKFWTFDETFNF